MNERRIVQRALTKRSRRHASGSEKTLDLFEHHFHGKGRLCVHRQAQYRLTPTLASGYFLLVKAYFVWHESTP